MSDPERNSASIYDETTCATPARQNVDVASGSLSHPDLDFPPDPELVAQGWQRRFMANPVRAKEAEALYSELGFEVHAEPVKPSELSEICGDCRLITCHAFVTIYTRRPSPIDPATA